MSYEKRRKENVRHEGDLMTHYINAHKDGDIKKKMDVQKHIDRNVNQRRELKRGV